VRLRADCLVKVCCGDSLLKQRSALYTGQLSSKEIADPLLFPPYRFDAIQVYRKYQPAVTGIDPEELWLYDQSLDYAPSPDWCNFEIRNFVPKHQFHGSTSAPSPKLLFSASGVRWLEYNHGSDGPVTRAFKGYEDELYAAHEKLSAQYRHKFHVALRGHDEASDRRARRKFHRFLSKQSPNLDFTCVYQLSESLDGKIHTHAFFYSNATFDTFAEFSSSKERLQRMRELRAQAREDSIADLSEAQQSSREFDSSPQLLREEDVERRYQALHRESFLYRPRGWRTVSLEKTRYGDTPTERPRQALISTSGDVYIGEHDNFKYLCGYIASAKNITSHVLKSRCITASNGIRLPEALYEARNRLRVVLATAKKTVPLSKPSSEQLQLLVSRLCEKHRDTNCARGAPSVIDLGTRAAEAVRTSLSRLYSADVAAKIAERQVTAAAAAAKDRADLAKNREIIQVALISLDRRRASLSVAQIAIVDASLCPGRDLERFVAENSHKAYVARAKKCWSYLVAAVRLVSLITLLAEVSRPETANAGQQRILVCVHINILLLAIYAFECGPLLQLKAYHPSGYI